MYIPVEDLFVFRIRRDESGIVAEGRSLRYTAIVLIGLANEEDDVATRVFDGRTARAACDGLLSKAAAAENLGDVALSLWAATLLRHENRDLALQRLIALDPAEGPHPTVEIAWALAALSADPAGVSEPQLAERIADRLFESSDERSGVFTHWPPGVSRSWLRAHVCCFADLVYPVQALSLYHNVTGHGRAMDLARRCGQFMCDGQGPAGQWWWHFDARTGRVVEGYPVYAVHQDAMAPMALFALQEAGGPAHADAVERGLRWLLSAPELHGGSLVEPRADLIWRKVARHEPGKLSRGIQAAASRVHPAVRAPGLASLFTPGRIDYECRPYHLGWLLHAWPTQRLEEWATKSTT
jgi:hypothetical protein